MKTIKLLGIMLAFLCSFAIVGCDDDVNYPNSKLIKGQWQLVEDGDTDNPLPKATTFGLQRNIMSLSS